MGDRVCVTSPTAVFVEFRDENSNLVVGLEAEDAVVGAGVENGGGKAAGDVAKLRNRSEVDGAEWQELDCFIGKRSGGGLGETLATVVVTFEISRFLNDSPNT